VEIEQGEPHVLVEPRRVRLGGPGFDDAFRAQADRFLGKRQLVHAGGDGPPEFELLAHHRHLVGAPACPHESAPAQARRHEQDHCARQEHASAETAIETAANPSGHTAYPLIEVSLSRGISAAYDVLAPA